MALAACSFIQMPLLRTNKFKSSSTKPMTITITCVNQKYKAKQVDRSRNGGYGPGPQTTGINLQNAKTTTRNLQLDNVYATTALSSVNDENDHNTSSPKRIGNVDYHYEI
ncbi:unnamed protein product [Lathyrus oleraceus]